MPFQSEKQRRYLWANEPEIARDWTDTYGSGIAKALGGRIGFWNGSGNIRQQPHQPRDLLVQNNPYGTRPRYQPPGGGETSLGSGAATSGGGGPPGGGDRQMTYTAPPTRSRIQDERQEDFRQRQMKDLLVRQQAEKDYTPQGTRKVGPQLSLAGSGSGRGGGFGNWASQFAGSKIGGGLGSMLFGPWGALLGAMFGRNVGKRGYQAYQTPEKETMQDILFGQNTLLSNLINKKKTPTGEGLGAIDLSDMGYDKLKTIDTSRGMYGFPYSRERPRGIDLSNMDYDKLKTIDPRMGMYGPRALGLNPNDLSSIEGQEAKLGKLPLIQMRFIEKKIKAPDIYGTPTPREEEIYKKLKEMQEEEKLYTLPIIT